MEVLHTVVIYDVIEGTTVPTCTPVSRAILRHHVQMGLISYWKKDKL